MRSLFAAEAAPEKKADEKERPDDPNKERSVQVYQARTRNFERRIKSEAHLEESLPWHFEKGAAYHCFSFGDVDALTYLRAVVKQQPLEYVALSTWCMAQTDVDEIRKWVERGLIGHVDFYVGEIFQASYAPIFLQLSELVRITPPYGRVAIFRNHSKVIIGFGDRFDFAVVTSANVNTNPRSECACLTVDTGVARFYKEEIFDKINSFNRDFDDWKPYKLKRDDII